MRLRASAIKHGLTEEAIIAAATIGLRFTSPLDDEHPQRELRLGFDHASRLLELVILRWDNGDIEVIHAMKARPQYLSLLDY